MKLFLAISGQDIPRCIHNIYEEGASTGVNKLGRTFYNDIVMRRYESIKDHKPFILDSFYYVKKGYCPEIKEYYGDFMLDSGAFTYIDNADKEQPNWDDYVEQFADFINTNEVKKYFELDIDHLIGYDKVKEYRKKLERLTGVQPIPVWHDNRGKDEFVRMCEEYPYVAIGGIAGGHVRSSNKFKWYIQTFPWFIDTAHKHGAKIHALGVTSEKVIKECPFDSVDSSSFIAGARFGHCVMFTGNSLKKVEPPANSWYRDSREIKLINYIEWVKFQIYAYNNF